MNFLSTFRGGEGRGNRSENHGNDDVEKSRTDRGSGLDILPARRHKYQYTMGNISGDRFLIKLLRIKRHPENCQSFEILEKEFDEIEFQQVEIN